MNNKNNNDLYDNPMVQAAKKALTPEQIEEYKRIGEYMYNKTDYHLTEVKSSQIKKANPTDLLNYAVQMIKSGGDPKDLTPEEVNMLVGVYGEKWYEQFDLEENDVPKPVPNSVQQYIEQKMKDMNLSRQQRRMVERQLNKEKKRSKK